MVRTSGKVNLIGLALILALIVGIWAVVIFSPIYLDNLDVKEAVAAAYNQAGHDSEEALRTLIKARTFRVGTHKEDDGQGNWVEKTGLGLTDEMITIERNPEMTQALIRIDYDREVELKPFKRIRIIHFSPQLKGPVK